MPSDAFVQFRVTPEVKTVLRTLAQREQISESAVVRQLLETMLRAQVQESSPKLTDVERLNRDTRVCVRLDEEDRVLLMSRAMQRGMRSAKSGLHLNARYSASVGPREPDGRLRQRIGASLPTQRYCQLRECGQPNCVTRDHLSAAHASIHRLLAEIRLLYSA